MARLVPRTCLLGLALLAACGDSPRRLTGGPENPDDPDDTETVIDFAQVDAGRAELPPAVPPITHVGGDGEFPDEPGEDADVPDEVDAEAPELDGGEVEEDAEAPVDAGTRDAQVLPDGCVVREAALDVDLLFMIDNSGSMAQEQAKLIEKLSRLVSALTSGNANGRRFTPPRSLHIGVVTSNLGAPPGVTNTASPSCVPDNGNNGVIQNSGSIASRDQIDANTQQVVRVGVPACADVALTPSYIAFGSPAGHVNPTDTTAFQNALFQFSCVATVGVIGCGVEQQLESLWKSLAPRSDDSFVGPDTLGQGDRANAGFLRADSVLATVVVSDEDDCSVTAAGTLMFERSGEPAVNVRCPLLTASGQSAGVIQPISRYAQGLIGLRSALPERLVFAGIVGLPMAGADTRDHASLLAHPQMQVALSPSSQTELNAVCGSDAADGVAFPGRRYVELARALRAAGASTVLESICRDDYTDVLDTLVDQIGVQLVDGCAAGR